MALTEEQKEDYIASEGMNCPVCGSQDCDCYEHGFEGNLVMGYCKCYTCGAHYTDVYRVGDVSRDNS